MQGSWLSFYAALQNDLPLFLLNNLKKKKDEELHHVGVPLPRQMVSLPLLPVQSEAPGRQTDHPSLVVHFFI